MAVADDGSAAYVGFERLAVAVQGRKGTFVLHHSASMTKDGGQSASWSVCPGSATDELKGLTERGEIIRASEGKHTFTLDYEIAE